MPLSYNDEKDAKEGEFHTLLGDLFAGVDNLPEMGHGSL